MNPNVPQYTEYVNGHPIAQHLYPQSAPSISATGVPTGPGYPQTPRGAGMPAQPNAQGQQQQSNQQQQQQQSNQQQQQQQQQAVGLVTPPDVALLAHQGYLAQQQQLAAMQGRQPTYGAGPSPSPTSMPGAGSAAAATAAAGPSAQTSAPGVAGASSAGIPGFSQMQLQQLQQAQLLQRAQQQQAVQQQQQLAQFQQAQQAHLAQQQGQQQGQGQAQQGAPVKKKRGRPSAASQALSRQTQALQPPHTSEHYIKNAMAPPSAHQPHVPHMPAPSPSHTASSPAQTLPHAIAHGHAQAQVHAQPSTGMGGVPGAEVEPWADGLDEIDPRELAMNRFRARHEILSEVFGPERIKDIPNKPYDPWAGLGIDGESLEAKVTALEAANAELEAKAASEIDAFRSRLQAIEAGV